MANNKIKWVIEIEDFTEDEIGYSWTLKAEDSESFIEYDITIQSVNWFKTKEEAINDYNEFMENDFTRFTAPPEKITENNYILKIPPDLK